jgi:hypothetical protein
VIRGSIGEGRRGPQLSHTVLVPFFWVKTLQKTSIEAVVVCTFNDRIRKVFSWVISVSDSRRLILFRLIKIVLY